MLSGGGTGENENHYYHHHHHQQQQQQQRMTGGVPLLLNPTISISTTTGEIESKKMKKKDERVTVSAWSYEETTDFISIRAELERDFSSAKRNKTLWEFVAVKMNERGYWRTPDQCKCKWKNLVNHYKGKETSDPENGRHCPFFSELQAVFKERAKNMQRLLVESEAGSVQTKKKIKRLNGEDQSSEDLLEDGDDGEDESEEEEEETKMRRTRKRKASDRLQRSNTSLRLSSASGIQEMLQEFFQQQERMEMQLREVVEKRARDWQLFEQEWRESMENLERERLNAEKAWREREEQRRIIEDNRAEKRDALLTTLLNKLIQEDHL